MCKFSIIVPCYNIEERVEKLFKMFQCKDYFDYEVIFVDDCSSDDSYDKMEGQIGKFTNYKLFKTEKNGGPGLARNAGLKYAQGDFVMFCDSDDEVNISVLKDIDFFLADHEDADLLVFPYSVKRRGKIGNCDEYSKYKQGDAVRIADVASDSGTPCAKVYRKSITDDNNIQFPARKSGEDKCFVVMYCTCISNAFKMDSIYYTYIMNRMSLTHSAQHEEKIITTFEILQPVYLTYFPDIVERMYAETYLLTYAKHFYATRAKNSEVKEFYKLANDKYPKWINNVGYENQSLYRKLIFNAMYKSRPIMIKFIMWIRRRIY